MGTAQQLVRGQGVFAGKVAVARVRFRILVLFPQISLVLFVVLIVAGEVELGAGAGAGAGAEVGVGIGAGTGAGAGVAVGIDAELLIIVHGSTLSNSLARLTYRLAIRSFFRLFSSSLVGSGRPHCPCVFPLFLRATFELVGSRSRRRLPL